MRKELVVSKEKSSSEISSSVENLGADNVSGFNCIKDLFDLEYHTHFLPPEFFTIFDSDASVYQMAETFFIAKEGRFASTVRLEDIRLKPFIDGLKKLGKVEIVESSYGYSGMPLSFMLNITPDDNSVISNRVVIVIGGIDYLEADNYPEYKADVQHIEGRDCIAFIDDNKVIFDSRDSKPLLSALSKLSEENGVDVQNEDPHIEMIIQTASGLSTRRIRFDLNYADDLDLHYGEGFSVFHKKLIERIGSRDKGIAMFHGPPGTGKTHYIRRLLPELSKSGKRAILIPKHVLGAIESPAFNEFMLSNFIGQKIVFVIEDSESIISKRSSDGGGRSEVVSTLLNVTDGILNDIFSIQVVLTFNTDLKSIDKALLRKGRLIAKYKFDSLNHADSKRLAEHLGVDSTLLKESNNLAEIYSLKEQDEDEVLINQNLLNKEGTVVGF